MANEVKEKFLQTFLDHVQELLQGVCGLPISSTHIEKLETAIRPHLDVAQALQLQESEYVLELPPATLGGSAQPLVADDMEDQSGEDEGFLQASLFPMVLKRVPDDGQSEVRYCGSSFPRSHSDIDYRSNGLSFTRQKFKSRCDLLREELLASS